MANNGFTVNTDSMEIHVKSIVNATKERLKRTMQELTLELTKAAVVRAPKREGNLRRSFRQDVVQDGNGTTGRVFIPSNGPSSRYALPMHEGRYRLGPGSRREQAASGVEVGRKYLTRALEDSRKRLWDMMLWNLNRDR